MSTLGLVLVVILMFILLGGVLGTGGPFGGTAPWGYGYGLHHGGIGIVGVILLIILVLAFTGRL